MKFLSKMKKSHSLQKAVVAFGAASMASASFAAKPNILAIWGDDVGITNVSAYSLGMTGYRTPNIDRIAKEGAIFTDAYGEQSCTAGRASFALGQIPFRTGLLTIGLPGSDHGIPEWSPSIGTVLQQQGYVTGQFGKNHLGDQDKHLPTNNGFDEFFGNLYHLNAEEEPEGYFYPKEEAFHKKYGPRGVIKASADGKIQDTGPMTRKRMETADEEILEGALSFMERAVKKEKKPFFVWFNATRMHIWTRLKAESVGVTGMGLYADGMVEHDGHVGVLLDKLDELGVADNTIVLYSSDNGVQKFTWPDGGASPFRGDKGTTWEAGHRVPLVVRWPGVIKPGTQVNDIISHMDWMPTFAAAAGENMLVEKLKKGTKLNGKKFKVHLDGYNFAPFFKGEAAKGPRETYYYFSSIGKLEAVRWREFKVAFMTNKGLLSEDGTMAQGYSIQHNAPLITHLRSDPYEYGVSGAGEMHRRWMVDQMWLFAPISDAVKAFAVSLQGYPLQIGGSLGASFGYDTLQFKKLQAQLQALSAK